MVVAVSALSMHSTGVPSSSSDARGRKGRAALAHETLQILEACCYSHTTTGQVTIDVQACIDRSRYVPAAEGLQVPEEMRRKHRTQVTVSSRSTLEACRQMAAVGILPAALNFASARNAGGGFLGGSQAQEESLARSSALYASQTSERCKAFYAAHSARGPDTWLYDDALIISPQCPVFRDDAGDLLPQPYNVTFITCAATNLSAIRQGLKNALSKSGAQVANSQLENEQDNGLAGSMHHGSSHGCQQQHIAQQQNGGTSKMEELTAAAQSTLVVRARRVLAAAAVAGCTHLVLGAWGCGVFGHDQQFVAMMWKQVLSEPEFEGVFQHVDFAVLGGSQVFEMVMCGADN